MRMRAPSTAALCAVAPWASIGASGTSTCAAVQRSTFIGPACLHGFPRVYGITHRPRVHWIGSPRNENDRERRSGRRAEHAQGAGKTNGRVDDTQRFALEIQRGEA